MSQPNEESGHVPVSKLGG